MCTTKLILKIDLTVLITGILTYPHFSVGNLIYYPQFFLIFVNNLPFISFIFIFILKKKATLSLSERHCFFRLKFSINESHHPGCLD